MSPYEALEVSQDADLMTIKKQYRKKAKQHHPDNGGEQTKMSELAIAFSILSDPDKRKRFDETGKTEEDNLQALIYAEFCRFCDEILLKNENMPVKKNVEILSKQVEQYYSTNSHQLQETKAKLERAKARIIKAPEHDVLGGMIDQGLRDVAKKTEELEKQVAISRQALKLFNEYEIKEPDFTSMYGMGSVHIV